MRVLPYLRLYRVSIALTPVADVALGFAIVASLPLEGGTASLPWELFAPAALVSILIFCSSVALNDVLDADKDRRFAPDRPIPAQTVTLSAGLAASLAAAAAALATAVALGLYPFIAASAVLGLAVAYNTGSRRIDWLGIVNLGLIRAADVSFGMVCAGLPRIAGSDITNETFFPVALYALYIICLATVALEERKPAPRLFRVVAFSFLALGLAVLAAWRAAGNGPAADAVIAASLVLLALPTAVFFLAGKKPVHVLVGHFLSGTFLLAAISVSGAVGAAAGAALAGLFILSRMLARRFPPS